MAEKKTPLVLDLHIPYCIRPQPFLDYDFSVGSNQEKNMYLVALGREIQSYAGDLEDYQIPAVRLGGGSASVMSPDLLGRVLGLVREKLPIAQGAEVSYDALPNTIGTPSLSGIAAGHPTRVELMMRSENDGELQALNCPFTMDDTRNAMLFFQKFHLNNVGVTVNYGIPGQTAHSWHNTLHACEIMGVKHITVSPLSAADDSQPRALGLPDFPGEEERLEMYRHACDFLSQVGYVRYGVGLFALPGFESQFRLLQMKAAPFVGMGVGNVSCFDGYLFRNTNNRALYMKNAGDFQKLTAQVAQADPDYQLRQLIRRGLALAEGLSLRRSREEHGEFPSDVQKSLDGLVSKGWAEQKDDRLILTESGQFHYRDILI